MRAVLCVFAFSIAVPWPAAQCLPAPTEILLPDSTGLPNEYGLEVDLSGDWAVVGSLFEDSKRGAIYVYRRAGTGWILPPQRLVAPDAAVDDEFGVSVAIDGNTLVVGARQGEGPGKAYVYALAANDTWQYRVRLAGSDSTSVSSFGSKVDISDDTIVVGAQGAPGGDSMTCPMGYCGAVYLYVRPPTDWPAQPASSPLLETARLISDLPVHGQRFGAQVAIDGDILAVTAYHGEHLGVLYAGAVYLFERPLSGWVSSLLPSAVIGSELPSQYGEFGVGLDVQEDSMNGDVLVVGARSQEFLGVEHGAAFVVREPQAGWMTLPRPYSASANLLSSQLSPEDNYGLSVAIDGDVIVVSAPLEDTPDGQDWGRAYVFQSACDEWEERFWLEASSVDLGGSYPPHLGGADGVAIQGRTVLIGTHLEDTTSGLDSGAARIFKLRRCLPEKTLIRLR